MVAAVETGLPGVASRRVIGPVLLVALVGLDLVSKAVASRWNGVSFVDPTPNPELMLGVSDVGVGPALVLSVMVVAAGVYGAQRLVAGGWLSPMVIWVGVAGFLGNAIDRLAFGHVRDWLVLGRTVWNLADYYLAAAIVLVLVAGIRSVLHDPEPSSSINPREEVKR